MSACCVSGCKNRHSSTSKLRFYRIPSGYRPFQANRRRLWLQAIQEVNGSTEELKGNARICGAHFISGQASMDHDSLDFVPSVFTCRKPSQGPQKEVKRGRGRPRRKARVQTEEKPTPSRVDSPVDLHSSVLMETEEETQTPSKPSVPTERRTRSKGAEVENETKTIKSQTSPRPNMTLSFKESAIQAIQEVNGSTEELKGNARICGAHFISGQASMDHDSLDFVPSVFTCRKPSQGPQKEVKRGRGRPRRKARVQTEEKSTPSRVDSPVDLHSSVLMETEEEETQTPSKPSVPTERRTRSKGAEVETEAKTIKSQTSPRPNKTSQSFKASAGFLKQHKISPIVLLKSVVSATGGYQCELCNQNFSSMSLLVKHKQLHEEQKSFICEICGKYFTSEADFTEHQRSHKDKPFPCNICDRSFSTNHNLKRHKLLHVKDGRKCRLCGVMFCRRHNHVAFLPQPVSDQESSVEPQKAGSGRMPESSLLKKPELSQTAGPGDDAQSTTIQIPLQIQTVSPVPPGPEPLFKMHNTPSLVFPTGMLKEIPVPVLVKPSSIPCPPPPLPKFPWGPGTSSQFESPLPDCPATFIQPHLPQHPELPPSLKLFSPQYLTSALLEVKRNYEYILSKPEKVKKDTVKEEECELPLISPDKQVKKERIAYDLEIIL